MVSRKAVKKPRDSREKILRVASKEFSNRGLAGARVDRIAELAKTSKNMIYHHLGNKEGLYQEVIRLAYVNHRSAELKSDRDVSDPISALSGLIERSFDHFCGNEVFVRLLMGENINRAGALQPVLSTLRQDNDLVIKKLRHILDEGIASGVFRSDIDPVSLHLTISALGFHYVSNRYTFISLFGNDMTSIEALAKRRAEVVDIVLSWCAPKAEQ